MNATAWKEAEAKNFRMRVGVSSVRGANLHSLQGARAGGRMIRSATSLEFSLEEKLVIMGSCLTAAASADAAVDYAVQAGASIDALCTCSMP